MQKIEIFGLGKLLGFIDTGSESIPGEHRFYSRERVSALSLGFDQRLPDPSVKAHLVIDRLPRALELLLMLVLCRIEHLSCNAIVQVDDLVDDCGCSLDSHSDQSCVTTLRLELG